MNTFTAHVKRDENWWIAQLEEDPGVMIQTRRLDQIADAIRDALILFPELTDAPEEAVIHLNVVGEAEEEAQATRAELQRLRKAENEQLQKMVELAHQLSDSGYNYRDIAYLLDITYGRVGQLIKKKQSEFRQGTQS